MGNTAQDDFLPQLLDLHLGHLTPAEHQACQARLVADPQLAQQDRALRTLFAALGSWTREPAPTGLPARVLARVANVGAPPRLIRASAELTDAAEATEGRIIRLGNLRDIVAVAAMIVLMVGVGVPSLLNMRDRNLRMGCSQNLALVGQALQQYASTYASSLPFVGWKPGASWRPSSDPNVLTISNRRHVYPLLVGRFIVDPRVLVCPGRGGVPMPPDQVRQRSDFLESRNFSYAYYNMAGVRPSRTDHPQLPVMADDNPAFDEGVPLFDRLGWTDRTQRNSPAHGGRGQNVLTLAGHMKWTTDPNSGIDGDNIWTLQGVELYNGQEGPTSPNDAHLIK